MKINIASNEVIHFIGIGGIGMSGLAQIMKNMGFAIQGSDLNKNKNTERLVKSGIKVFLKHDKKNLKNATTIVVSSANVIEPVAVRYAWAMNPSQRNLLYNEEGLPASPFRTDNWELCDPEADIVEVTKPQKPSDYTSRDWDRPVMKQ